MLMSLFTMKNKSLKSKSKSNINKRRARTSGKLKLCQRLSGNPLSKVAFRRAECGYNA